MVDRYSKHVYQFITSKAGLTLNTYKHMAQANSTIKRAHMITQIHTSVNT